MTALPSAGGTVIAMVEVNPLAPVRHPGRPDPAGPGNPLTGGSSWGSAA
jgi:hypothetical protein